MSHSVMCTAAELTENCVFTTETGSKCCKCKKKKLIPHQKITETFEI